MLTGTVRKLRVTVPAIPGQASDIDDIQDPFMLAHRMLELDGRRETRKCDSRLRMSSINDVCVRAQLIGLRKDISKAENIAIGMRVTFDMGNAIHDFLQNCDGYLGKNRLGWWRCLACGSKIFGRRPNANCKSCGALSYASRYVEHALRMPDDLPVSGHIDGFVEVAPADIRIIDFKTISGEEFVKLTAPKPEHCVQVNGYMHYIGKDTNIPVEVNQRSGFLLYVSKKHVHNGLPFKLFHVRRNQDVVNFIENKVALFKRGLDDVTFFPDPLRICAESDFTASACRSCNVMSYCKAVHHGQPLS